MERLFEKRFCHFNNFHDARSAWSRAITAFANELAVGDNGALDVTLMYGDKQDHPGGMSYYTGDTMSGYIQITLRI